jgi:hypothetical protein
MLNVHKANNTYISTGRMLNRIGGVERCYRHQPLNPRTEPLPPNNPAPQNNPATPTHQPPNDQKPEHRDNSSTTRHTPTAGSQQPRPGPRANRDNRQPDRPDPG